MQIDLDPEAEALVQRAMEVEGWPTPAVAVRELLAKYAIEPAGEEERVAGYPKEEILRLVAEAKASPSREYTIPQLREELHRRADARSRRAG